MHPVIRVVSFLVFCVALARPDPGQLIVAVLLIGGLLFTLTLAQVRQTLVMVRRLRWLLLSILVIYGWFTPGVPLDLPLPEYLLPTRAGLEEGAPRVLTLILILLAAGILLVSTSRQQLIAALYWLLSPLRHLRWPPERLAIRLALTLDYVTRQASLWQIPPTTPATRGIRGRITHIAQHLAGLLPQLFEQAEQPSTREVTLDILPPPSVRQWGWPVLLVIGLMAGALIELS